MSTVEMGESSDPVYGAVMNNGALFTQATTALVAGFRQPRPKRGDGVLEMVRWIAAYTTPEYRQRITKDSRSVREIRSWNDEAPEHELDNIHRLMNALAKDMGIAAWTVEPETLQLYRAVMQHDERPGAWIPITSVLTGIRTRFPDLQPKLKRYLDFIDAHLKLERSLLKRISIEGEQARIECEVYDWLVLPDTMVEDNAATYPGVARLLLWLALVDLGIRIAYSNEDSSSTKDISKSWSNPGAVKYLPTMVNGSYYGGVAKLLRHLQTEFATAAGKFEDGARTSRITMCRTIERLIEEQLNVRLPCGVGRCEVPARYRANAIDERLGRYVSGKEYFGMFEVRELLGYEEVSLITLVIALIGQMDDLKRSLMAQTDVSLESVVDAYARYPEIYAIVNRRFSTFLKEDQLRP